ncbi:GntR family transcriptional regulator [Acuticoccus sediminis]|uniref:GntR family transcriptional regulator n=1 Tax=Acuticoccus sediminis TaxID=2184697 RepID=A0A8B2NQY2_9HYPH|nr:GntR family transcriptional regulator [Acuticoccus sediminis]RAH97409.1 GntR family transcriptional regulator [Acuticoccus sediminis]
MNLTDPLHSEDDAARRGLRSLAQKNLAQEVYAELKRGLMTGGFLPGAKLKIRDLADVLGVSPTPVREALMQLVADGALTQTAGRSFAVPELDADDYDEVRRLRVLIEGEGASLAAARATEADVRALEEVHDALIRAKAAGDFRGALIWNEKFHRGLCELSGSKRLIRIVEGLWLHMGPLMNVLYQNRQMPAYSESRHGHLDVLEGLRTRNGDMARDAIQQDITGAAGEILRNLRGSKST